MRQQLSTLPSADRRAPFATNRQVAVRLAVMRALNRARDLDEIYDAALDALGECLDVSRAAVLLFDPDGVMRFKAHRGLSTAYRAAVQGHSPWTPGSLNPVPLVVPDVKLEPTLESYLPHITREHIGAMTFIPLVSLGRVIGKLMLYRDEPHVFDGEEVHLAQVIAGAVAFAVERARIDEVAHRSPKGSTFTPSATSIGAWEWDVSDGGRQSENDASLAGLPSGTLRQINRCIIENSRDCLGLLDLEGRLTYINSEGTRLLGLQASDEILHRPIADFWQENHRETVYEAIARARSGAVGSVDGAFTTPAGAANRWDMIVAPIIDDSGEVVQLLAVSRDISAPWQREAYRIGQHQVLEMIATGAPLRQILTLLAHLIEEQCAGMLCSVVLIDADGVHMRLGAAPSLPPAYSERLNGTPIGSHAFPSGAAMRFGRPVILKDILTEHASGDIRDLAIAHGFRACWAAPIFSLQMKVLGSFEMFYSTPREPDGDHLRLIEAASDLAGIAIEHGRFQEALRQSEERNRAILRAIPDWMFVVDRDGMFLEYHGRDQKNLLMRPDVFIGRSVYDVLPLPLAETHQHALERTFRTNEPETFEYSLELQGESRFYEACIVRCDTDKALSIVRDVTDRKRAELDAAEQRSELAHLNRVFLLGELSGTLAHELSQPLAAALTNAEAARRFLGASTLDLPELRATLDDVIENGKRAGAVISRLRTLLKKGESSPQSLGLNEVVAEVLDLMHSDLLFRRISVTTAFAPELPAVLGDRVQLQQVILNLVLNACDAMMKIQPAERRLGVATKLDGAFVQVSVSDEGPGIPEGQLQAIFEPFVTFSDDGLGLGLAISRSIVVAHRGRITAENNSGRGATLRCFLPVARA